MSAVECPWDELRLWGGLPNVKWCEAPVCSLVTEPANTWSNLAYVLVGLLLVLLARKETSVALRLFGPAGIAIGLCSFVYHASIAFVTQLLDFAGMYCFFGLALTINVVRLGLLSAKSVPRVLTVGVVGMTAVTYGVARLGLPIQALIAGAFFLVLLTEAMALRLASPRPSLRPLSAAVGCFVLAAVCSGLDVSRVWCDPNDHLIQGHAVWHLLGAVSLGFSLFHYRQFRSVL